MINEGVNQSDIKSMRVPFRLNWESLTPVYLAVVVLGSIVAHLASEFFAMGNDAESVALSPKHLYLAIAAFGCAAFALARTRAIVRATVGWRDLKRELHVGLQSLPFGGRGLQFYALTAALQLTFGLATQYGEGCPFCGHDIAAGIAGALLTLVALALVGWIAARRLPSLAAAIEALFVGPQSDQHSVFITLPTTAVAFPHSVWSAQLYNRPPPVLSTP